MSYFELDHTDQGFIENCKKCIHFESNCSIRRLFLKKDIQHINTEVGTSILNKTVINNKCTIYNPTNPEQTELF